MLGTIYERLANDDELAELAPGGVHLYRAPQDTDASDGGTVYPLVTVRRRPGGRIIGTLGLPRAARVVNVEVLGIVKDAAGSLEAERIDERIDVLLADHLPSPVNGFSLVGCRRFTDVDLSTVDDGVEWDRVGGLYRVWMSGEAAS